MERIETIVIGGGQAGLAMSYHLARFGREHIVLERQRVAERWRTERWDSLAFQSPNWNIHLPGLAYRAADPDAFAPRDEVSRFIEDYAAFIKAPLRCGQPATSLRRTPDLRRLIVETPAASFEAKNVVIATGPFQQPAERLPIGGKMLHLHSSQYRNPQSLPSGAALVIGSGNSGAQIAEELCLAGRRVFLSVSPHRRIPRRYRTKDYTWWYVAFGEGDTTIEQQREPLPPRLLTGVGGGHDLNLRQLAADGVTLLGRVTGGSDGRLSVAQDLAENLMQADASLVDFIRHADEYALRERLGFPPSDSSTEVARDPPEVNDPVATLDLAAAGISTIIWANGFRYDFDWIDLPVFAGKAASSVPVHRRGVTAVPGVYFLGLPWLYRLKSAFLHGVGEDAEYLAEHIASGERRLCEWRSLLPSAPTN